MKRTIIFLTVLLCLGPLGFAIPARPGKITAQQPDGSSIEILRHGDEWGHWITDASGNVLKLDTDGFYRAAIGESASSASAAASRRRSQKISSRRLSPQAAPVAIGKKRFLVILVQFSDLSFNQNSPKAAFDALLNKQGYSEGGGTGSARDFYFDNSHGIFEPVFDVYGPVTLENNKAYYGANDSQGYDKAAEKAVLDACVALRDEIDFSNYDNDGDGYVDLVFMYYAGYGEADSSDSDAIWPHQWELSSAGLSFSDDGVKVDSYACSNEIVGYGSLKGQLVGIGAACHEFGHAIGLPDFYDVDYETNGMSGGLFSFSTMDVGCYNNESRTPPYFNIEERILLGWLDGSALLDFTPGTVTIPSVHGNIAYKTPTDMDGEYFVYECRNSEGWDNYLPAHGLIVYHVDKSERKVKISDGTFSAKYLWDNWRTYNSINENGSHPCFYIVPSGAQDNLKFGYTGYHYDTSCDPRIPFPGKDEVSTYCPISWNGVKGTTTLSDIRYSQQSVTLKVEMPSADLSYPLISNPGNGTYSGGQTFTLALEGTDADKYDVTWYFDDVAVSGTSLSLTPGEHTIEAVLGRGSKRKVLTLEITVK